MPRRALVLATALAAVLAVLPAAARARTCNGAAALCSRTFDHVVLPGAHNAMSSQADHFGAPNQQVGIPTQLRDGIRAFLIDVYAAHRGPDGKLVQTTSPTSRDRLYLCHVSCQAGALRFDRMLAQVAAYLHLHGGNVLLFDVEDHAPSRMIIKAIKASPLARWLYRGRVSTPWPTLQSMIAHRGQVVMLAEQHAAGAPWYHRAYADVMQETPYSWPDETVLEDPAKQPSSCVPYRGGTRGSLFLMNHWSPPFPADAAVSARVNDPAVIVSRARACAAARGLLPTIVAVDMARSGDVVGAVRTLNGV